MEAKVLLCNWCRAAKGRKAVFATVPITVEIGGPNPKTYRLDGCAPHGSIFARGLLVGTTLSGKVPKQRASRSSPDAKHLVPLMRVEASVLRVLRGTRQWQHTTQLFGKVPGARRSQYRDVMRKLLAKQVVEQQGVNMKRAYRLTASGKRVAKATKPDTVLAKIAPTAPLRAEITGPILDVLATIETPMSGPALFSHTNIPGRPGAQKEALLALREQGFVTMHGTRGRARYELTVKGRHAREKKNGAPTGSASAPSGENRAARRLRRERRRVGPRRRHRR